MDSFEEINPLEYGLKNVQKPLGRYTLLFYFNYSPSLTHRTRGSGALRFFIHFLWTWEWNVEYVRSQLRWQWHAWYVSALLRRLKVLKPCHILSILFRGRLSLSWSSLSSSQLWRSGNASIDDTCMDFGHYLGNPPFWHEPIFLSPISIGGHRECKIQDIFME